MLRNKYFVKYFAAIFFALFLSFSFSKNKNPCVKESFYVFQVPPYDTIKYIKEFLDCNDKGTYYLKSYSKNYLNEEGNIVNNLREGTWKFYGDKGLLSSKKLYHQDKLFKETFFNGDEEYITRNYSENIIYEHYKDKEQGEYRSGFRTNEYNKSGIWEEENQDSICKTKSIGIYFTQCDTITFEDTIPPYSIIDSVICRELKDGTWFYFDEEDRLLKIEKYKKGKL